MLTVKHPPQRRAQAVFNAWREGPASSPTSKNEAQEHAHNTEYTMMGKDLSVFHFLMKKLSS